MKTLSVFCGSRQVSPDKRSGSLRSLDNIFSSISGKVDRVIYGGGRYGVMGDVYDMSVKHGIDIIGYSLEKYRKSDSTSGTIFFPDDSARAQAFYDDGDAFLGFTGGLGTINEILHINEMIKRNNSDKKIYIPPEFEAFYNMIDDLNRADMIADEDVNNFVGLDDIGILRI